MKRGQISLEYIIVVGFVMFAVIILLGISFFYAASVQDQIKLNQLSTFAEKIIHSAESIYYAGEPSKVTITAFLPKGMQNFDVNSNSLVFTIATSSGQTIIAYESAVPISDFSLTLNEGVKRITITAGDDIVNVAEG